MGLPKSNDGEARFSAYVEGLTGVMGIRPGQGLSALDALVTCMR
jgi:hypothetical protein